MEDNILLKIITGLLGLITVILGWNVRIYKADHDRLKDEHGRLKDDHNNHKLNVSENYAKKNDLNEARREQTEQLRRVYEKIESVDSNLDDKISAVNTNLDKKISDLPKQIIELLNNKH